MSTEETQVKEVVKVEQPALVPAQTLPAEEVNEEVQKKSILEKASALLASIGIESKQSRSMLLFVLLVIFVSSFVSFLMLPPADFPQDKTITVKGGASLGQISLLLSNEHLIRSRTLFEFCVMTAGGDKGVHAGQYLFKEPVGACAMALRLVEGVSGIPAIRVTIPEGLSDREVATILGEKLPQFNATHFVEHARELEGYLFPDTYFFLDDVTPETVADKMKSNFDKKINPLVSSIQASGHSLRDIITMASILEREATTDVDREIVSGILWKRIRNGIPLQVDAPFVYLLGKKSSELTQTDLQIKSAYNTYRNKGLPGGPIDNPGLSAINAALNPKDSPYLYYLSDNDGVMHYAKTFDEHIANKAKYLK